MRRLLPALALLLVFAAPGAARAADFTKTALTFDVKVGPKGDQPCTITANLFKPSDVSKANPAPAVLATNGFGGSKADFDDLAASYAKRGYVFLAYSGLGFGGSGCKITLDDPDFDGRAGSQLVSFLGGSKAAQDGTKADYVIKDATAHDGTKRPDDPRVGMIGGSYGGQIQFSIAGQDPRVDALVPQITWNDLAYSLTPNNTDFKTGVSYDTPGVAKLDWPTLFTGVGVAGTFQGDQASHVGQCPNFDDRVCLALVDSATRSYPSQSTIDFLRHASVSSYVAGIRIPTLLAQGQDDNLFDLQEAITTYRSLRAQGTPVKMLWRSAGHSGGSIGNSENDETDPEKGYESRMELEWLDYYLRGLGDAPPLDFSFITDWLPYAKGADAAPAVASTPNYPAATEQPLYLSGTDALVPGQGDVKAGAAQFAAVPGAPTSSGGGFQDPSASDAPGTSVSFTTAALTQDTDVAGPSKLTVHLDAPTFAQTQSADPGTHLVLFAKLYDVAPDGTAVLPRKLNSAARVADVTKPVTIELPGIVHRFAKGHKMRLTLATSSLSYRGNNAAGPVTVTVDPAAPSVLSVPRLGAPSGAAGTGPNGSTPFTPPAGDAKPQAPGAGVQPGVVAKSSGAATLPADPGTFAATFAVREQAGLPHPPEQAAPRRPHPQRGGLRQRQAAPDDPRQAPDGADRPARPAQGHLPDHGHRPHGEGQDAAQRPDLPDLHPEPEEEEGLAEQDDHPVADLDVEAPQRRDDATEALDGLGVGREAEDLALRPRGHAAVGDVEARAVPGALQHAVLGHVAAPELGALVTAEVRHRERAPVGHADRQGAVLLGLHLDHPALAEGVDGNERVALGADGVARADGRQRIVAHGARLPCPARGNPCARSAAAPRRRRRGDDLGRDGLGLRGRRARPSRAHLRGGGPPLRAGVPARPAAGPRRGLRGAPRR